MRVFVYFLLLCIAGPKLSAAQNGYDISIDATDAQNEKITLSYYMGTFSQAYVVDSAVITQPRQRVNFKKTAKILGGIYQLKIVGTDKNNYINIIADNGAKLDFSLQGRWMRQLQSLQKQNKEFLLMQVAPQTLEEKRTYLESLAKDYPTSVLVLYCQLELKKIALKTGGFDTLAKKGIRQRFIKDVDLKDRHMQIMPNAYSFLLDYISLLPISDLNYQEGVDILLKGFGCKTPNYFFYLEWFFKNLDYFQQGGLAKTVTSVYTKYLLDKQCFQVNQKFFDKITLQVRQQNALPIGTVLPDFTLADTARHELKFSDMRRKGKYTFLAIYDPDCVHCKEILPKAAAYFSRKNFGDSLVRKVALSIQPDVVKWHDFIAQANIGDWLNGIPAATGAKLMSDLKLSSFPQFFLVDDTGKILLKVFDEGKITSVIE